VNPVNPNDPAAMLPVYLRILAQRPYDVDALTNAGQAALAVGDPNAALGFLARAEELSPRNMRVKVLLGSTLTMLEKPEDALRYFGEAVSLGATERDYAKDRGLAYDMRGDQKRAQKDYQAAIKVNGDPEIVRRYALSLGISGEKQEALDRLTPLVRRNDQGAWRARAFVLAMNGEQAEASRIARQVTPLSAAASMDAFLRRLASLNPAQRAHAVNFGTMPADGVRYAAAANTDESFRAISSETATILAPRPSSAPTSRPQPTPTSVTSREEDPRELRRRERREKELAKIAERSRKEAGRRGPQVAVVDPSLRPPVTAPTPRPLPSVQQPPQPVAQPPVQRPTEQTGLPRRVGERIGPVDPNRLPPELRTASGTRASNPVSPPLRPTIVEGMRDLPPPDGVRPPVSASVARPPLPSMPTSAPPSASTGLTLKPDVGVVPLKPPSPVFEVSAAAPPAPKPEVVATTPALVSQPKPVITVAPPPPPAAVFPPASKPVFTPPSPAPAPAIAASEPSLITKPVVTVPEPKPAILVTQPSPLPTPAIELPKTPAASIFTTPTVPVLTPPTPTPAPPVAIAGPPTASPVPSAPKPVVPVPTTPSEVKSLPVPGFSTPPASAISSVPLPPSAALPTDSVVTPPKPVEVAVLTPPAAIPPATSTPDVSPPLPASDDVSPPQVVAPKPDAPEETKGLGSVIQGLELEAESAAAPVPTDAQMRALRLAAQRKAEADEAAKAKKDKDATDARAKLEADRLEAEKAKKLEEAAKAADLKKNPARLWVQIATGANRSGLPITWRKLRDDAPKALAKQAAWFSPIRATHRLLVGPVKSSGEARSLVNALGKEGVQATIWSSEAGQEVTRLGGR
jgi:Flp pilus assembly protein TadD